MMLFEGTVPPNEALFRGAVPSIKPQPLKEDVTPKKKKMNRRFLTIVQFGLCP